MLVARKFESNVANMTCIIKSLDNTLDGFKDQIEKSLFGHVRSVLLESNDENSGIKLMFRAESSRLINFNNQTSGVLANLAQQTHVALSSDQSGRSWWRGCLPAKCGRGPLGLDCVSIFSSRVLPVKSLGLSSNLRSSRAIDEKDLVVIYTCHVFV